MHKYLVTPISKPRMTRAVKWKQRPPVMRYRLFCDEIRLQEIQLPEAGGHVTFVKSMPMPQSWSKKKRTLMDRKPHKQKPDIDNLEKALLDALFDDDAHIWDHRATKIWGEEGPIIIWEGSACNCTR